jgi:leucyl-tRNA synthetase
MHYSKETDIKWRKIWEDTNLYKYKPENIDKKLYCLEMFSYPSGANLHIGHWYNFGLTDSWARMKRMQGNEVFHPMGFDAFGLPAENYAIKTGIHPQDSTLKSVKTMENQLKEMGATFDWDYELVTCDPNYYKWTQWLFLKLYDAGLAQRKEAPVNWCPSCKTVLANEQVINGECERCSSEVSKKRLTQWFFTITDYAEKLLRDIDVLDWPEKTKKIQKNWIGKSTGTNIIFDVVGSDKNIEVFTTRADTLFGCTYVVIAPENPLIDDLMPMISNKDEVDAYIKEAKKKSDLERSELQKDKTGVRLDGVRAINPINGKEIEVFVADYVLASYGTGSVMAVPAHDERDFEFAKKYDIEIKYVIQPVDIINLIRFKNIIKQQWPKSLLDIYNSDSATFIESARLSAKTENDAFTSMGILFDSEEFTGLTSAEAKKAITEKLKSIEHGDFTINYKLRDWLVSRQRYWGAPIPVIHCDKCGIVPVPEKDLPVLLPYDVEFTPDGESPLGKSEKFVNTTCPKCGGKAKRDTDTLDTFVCSSWYYLRYPDNRNAEKAFDTELINKMLPVDKYVGGQEHATMHLLYARFITKVLHDLGYLKFDEPFKSLIHQGTILAADGTKMSKSKGNSVSPDKYIDEYGSDVLRLYLGFGFAYSEGGPWNEDGIKATSKFLGRVERLVEMFMQKRLNNKQNDSADTDSDLDFVRHNTIKAVTEDTERFQFNTSIARLMEYVNALYKYFESEKINVSYAEAAIIDLMKLLSPFAPHFAEEMWQKLGLGYSIFNEKWPVWSKESMIKQEVEIVIQINGKLRDKITVSADIEEKELLNQVMTLPKVVEYTAGKEILKTIVIPKKLVSIVIK